jgi:hypothetical protein
LPVWSTRTVLAIGPPALETTVPRASAAIGGASSAQLSALWKSVSACGVSSSAGSPPTGGHV